MDLTSNRVFLEKCPDYSKQNLKDICNRMIIPCLSSNSLNAKRVLLKPNLISARLGSLACTEGEFVLAAAKWFLDHNALVTIGDSPAFGTATSVLQKIGIADALRRLPVSITDFSRVRHVSLPSGISAGVSADALECDLLVNIPRVKAHAQLRVTLAVKNLFGCLVGMRKPLWHMIHGSADGIFTDLLVELLSVLPDSITLMDGVTAMHRTGPIGGQPFPLGIIASSTNPVAVDRSMLAILGVNSSRCPLMNSCASKKINGVKLSSLDFPFLSPAELAVDSFVVPGELSPIRFNPFRFIRGSMKRILLKLGFSS